MNRQEFCKAFNLTMDQFYGKSLINVPIYFEEHNVTEIPVGFNPNIKGHLDLGQTKYIPKNFSPTVSGEFSANNVMLIGKNFSPSVGGSLYLESLIRIPVGFNPTIGCDLCIGEVRYIPNTVKVGNNIYFNLPNQN